MKAVLFVCFLILGFCSVGLSENNDPKEKLLQQLAETKVDTARLAILCELTKITYLDSSEQIIYIGQLLQEAEKHKNNYYKCYAYLQYMIQAYNRFDGDGVDKWMELLEPLARKGKFYDLLFRGKQCVIDMLLLREEYELEEKEANLMLKEARELDNIVGQISAYHSLAHVYYSTHREEMAFEVLEKAIQLGPLCNNQWLYSEVLRTMALICENLKDFTHWSKYLKLQEELISSLEKQHPFESLSGDKMLNYISYLKYSVSLKNWDEAAVYMKLIDENYSEEYNVAYKYNYLVAKVYYYLVVEDWSNALEKIEQILALVKSRSEVEYVNRLTQKAGLLRILGRTQEALVVHHQVKYLRDSLQEMTIKKQEEQLESAYKDDLQVLDQQEQRRRIQQIFLYLLGVIFLILAASIAHANRVKRKLTKAEQEMRKMTDETEQVNKIKERFLSNINMTIRPPLEIIVNSSSRLASDEEINETEKERLSVLISTTSGKLMEMINDILILSRLEAGMMKFMIKEIEIIPFIHTFVEVINQPCPGTVCVDIAGSGYKINGDETYLKQVLNSLCKFPVNTGEAILLQIGVTESSTLQIKFINTQLAVLQPTQDIAIYNEINRMIIEAFGGKYQIGVQQDTVSYVALVFDLMV